MDGDYEYRQERRAAHANGDDLEPPADDLPPVYKKSEDDEPQVSTSVQPVKTEEKPGKRGLLSLPWKKKEAPSESNDLDTLKMLLSLYNTVSLHIREHGRGFYIDEIGDQVSAMPEHSYSVQQQRTGLLGQILTLHPGYPSPDGEFGPVLVKGIRNRDFSRGGIQMRGRGSVVPFGFSKSFLSKSRTIQLEDEGLFVTWTFLKRGYVDMKCVDDRNKTLVALWESELKGSLDDLDHLNFRWHFHKMKLGCIKVNRAYIQHLEAIVLSGLMVEEERISQFPTLAYHRMLQFMPQNALEAPIVPMLPSGLPITAERLFVTDVSEVLTLSVMRTKGDSYQVIDGSTPPVVYVEMKKASLGMSSADYWRYEILDVRAPDAEPVVSFRTLGSRESVYEYPDEQSTILVSYRGPAYFQTPRGEFSAKWVGNIHMKLIDLFMGIVVGEFRYVGINLKKKMGTLRINKRYEAFLDIICATAINLTEEHIFEINHQAGIVSTGYTPLLTAGGATF